MKRPPLFFFAMMLIAACNCDVEPGGGEDGGGGIDGGTDASRSDSGGGSDAAGWDVSSDGPVTVSDGDVVIMEDGGDTWVCRPVMCAGHMLECGDCIDNDGDGRVDSRDPECLGPCDNTEGPGLLAGIGGEGGGPCRADCYFDFGNGSGNDECMWDSRCDPLSIAPDFHPEGEACAFDADRVGGRTCPDTQTDTCHEVCSPLTPNGCDCFGCCTFDDIDGRSAADGGEFVWLGSVFEGTNDSSCTLDDIEDTSLCRPCTPVADCFNDCGECELCVGRDTIPDECFGDPDAGTPDSGTDSGVDGGGVDSGTPPPPSRCPEGVVPCGLPGDAECPVDTYCVTGCCQYTLI